MDSNKENAMIILKAMVESSRVWTSGGDAIRRITNLQCSEINDGVECLEEMDLVKTIDGKQKVRYNFFNVRISQKGYDYYHDNLGKIKSIE